MSVPQTGAAGRIWEKSSSRRTVPRGAEQAQTQICLRGALQDIAVGFFQDEMFPSLQFHLGIRKSSSTAGHRTISSCWFACCDIPDAASEHQECETTTPVLTCSHNTLTLTSSGTKEQCSRVYNSLLQWLNSLFKDHKAASRNVLLTLSHRKCEQRLESAACQGHALSRQHYLSQEHQNRRHHARPRSV